MSWITTVSYEDSSGKLRRLYDRVKGPDNNVDNIMMGHSLRPHSMEGHMALYKNVLHHTGNSIPKYFLETIGVWVSMLNHCNYCVEHHFSGLKRLIESEKFQAIRDALESDSVEGMPFSIAETLALEYARTLTLSPPNLEVDSIAGLQGAGYSDGEILEINQVVAYFNYANRTVLGLGLSTKGDILGLSPNKSEDPDNWSHS